MSYAEITFKDKNPVKRWLQRRRLVSAVQAVSRFKAPAVVCDFGAGNGELCKLLSRKYPNARIICYEPVNDLLLQAKENLSSIPNVEFHANLGSIQRMSVDILFCLEVFEHLPLKETEDALQQIDDCLKDRGLAVFGVPIEIGLPALYKGCFRMLRRFGEYDANPKNVLYSLIGIPLLNRPTAEIAPGFQFHFHHTGFDYRRLKNHLRKQFELLFVLCSPFPVLGRWLNPEIYFVTQKKYR
ncbi:class I SAM-dependent methyltransferase [Noviherbaspirillum massiliense]|uniref:class I SAM-dependent methyltransferase n=1 Tax=Noviherbaspirillum massiliense TaxID=1465823 RepID=UPI00036C1B5A|nr:class I SAM-dependent methyltransferase [Noviherbaspirillum massiliense]